MRLAIITLMLAVLAVLAACQSPDELLPVVHNTPLEHDPTDRIELPTWWTNGRDMLRLNGDSSYARYASTNRYRTPSERGRWSQGSYAVLWLEPYDSRRPERVRVAIGRDRDEIVLVLPERAPLYSLRAAPVVLEDELIDQWAGPDGRLVLRGSMKYTFSPAPHPIDAPAMVAGHSGRWEVEADDAVVLHPDPTSISPLRLRIDDDGEAITLRSTVGTFEKVAAGPVG